MKAPLPGRKLMLKLVFNWATPSLNTTFNNERPKAALDFMSIQPKLIRLTLAGSLVLCGAALLGCGTPTESVTPTTSGSGGESASAYDFPSAFVPNESSVAHEGQTLRHVLVADLIATVEGLTARLDGDTYNPTSVTDTVALLEHYYAFDSQTGGTGKPQLATTPAALQATYDAIATGKTLKEKLAGNDASTDHKDWTTAFTGWKDASIAVDGGSTTSPEGLLYAYFGTLGKLALDRENGVIPLEPGTTSPLAFVHVTATGLDLHELIEKHLELAIGYSQGTDDYLDDDVADKGLRSPNTQDGTKPYTLLAHGWDEAFGYFGAARDYAAYTDDELAASGGRADWQGFHDSNADGAIDLTREFNFSLAVTGAKRDRASAEPTDFTGDAFAAALAGRALIQSAGATLSATELATLTGHRDAWVTAWERALAATVIHELNEIILITGAIGTPTYDFYAHAGEWSELKGYALGLQYNPKKKLTDAEFASLHDLLGDKPVLATATVAERSAYVKALLTARELLQTAYGFSAANVEAW